ncbi:Flp family type IVb pilin [Sphingobium sp. D43FB]|uniref:Flp family type IVb pilin n=1 Tax=Sphingobium sp. D43FB TaxID=2017595 RepID=UPI000BB54E18|nr:Flp family type IVb pilin [Sphingobium sp. D43FB]PBN43871.1 Flp family type IVb pilin [Sphingobium sp. D43FB]
MLGLNKIMGHLSVLRCERGATAVEYGLIIALIVLAMITALTSVADKTTGMWNNVSTEVTSI